MGGFSSSLCKLLPEGTHDKTETSIESSRIPDPMKSAFFSPSAIKDPRFDT